MQDRGVHRAGVLPVDPDSFTNSIRCLGSALLNPYGSLAVGYETGELLIYKAITGEKVELSTAVYTKTVERPLCRVRYGPTGAVLAIAYGDGKSELINPFINSK